jgi:hypothetical protein
MKGRKGYVQTLKAICYASTPWLLFGWLLFLTYHPWFIKNAFWLTIIVWLVIASWELIVSVQGIRAVQNFSIVKAFAVVLLSIIISIAFFYMIFSSTALIYLERAGIM